MAKQHSRVYLVSSSQSMHLVRQATWTSAFEDVTPQQGKDTLIRNEDGNSFDEIKPPGPAAPSRANEGAGLPPRPGPSTPVIPHYESADGVISTTSNTFTALLVIRTSKQELLLAATSVCSGGAFQCVIHILFYVQLYINVNSLQRVTRIHNHYSQNDKIVKLGLPQPWIKATCKKYPNWQSAAVWKKSGKHNSGSFLIIHPFRSRVVVQLQKFGHRDQECRKLQIGYHNKISSGKFSFKIIRIKRLG